MLVSEDKWDTDEARSRANVWTNGLKGVNRLWSVLIRNQDKSFRRKKNETGVNLGYTSACSYVKAFPDGNLGAFPPAQPQGYREVKRRWLQDPARFMRVL